MALQILVDAAIAEVVPMIADFKLSRPDATPTDDRFRTPINQQRLALFIGESFQSLFSTESGKAKHNLDLRDDIICWLFAKVTDAGAPAVVSL